MSEIKKITVQIAHSGLSGSQLEIDGKEVTAIKSEALIKKYDAEDVLRMQRPSAHSFDTDSAEFYRWYEYGGQERMRPLDQIELIEFLQAQRGFSPQEAEERVLRDSLARTGDRQLWDHLISEKRNPSMLGTSAQVESIKLHFMNAGEVFATRENLTSVEAEKIIGEQRMRRITTEIKDELLNGNDSATIRGRIDEAPVLATSVEQIRANPDREGAISGKIEQTWAFDKGDQKEWESLKTFAQRKAFYDSRGIVAEGYTDQLEQMAVERIKAIPIEQISADPANERAFTPEQLDRRAVERIEQRYMAYEEAYMKERAPALAALESGAISEKLAALNKRDIEIYSPEQIEQWVKADAADISRLFVRDSDRYEDAALSMALSERVSPSYKAKLAELAPDIAKIVDTLEAENNQRIEAKEIRKSLEAKEMSYVVAEEQENAIMRGNDPELAAAITYEGTALLQDGTEQKFYFDALPGLTEADLLFEAHKAWDKIAVLRAERESEKRHEHGTAQAIQRINNKAVREAEEKAAEEPDKTQEPGKTQQQVVPDVSKAVPEKIQKRFLNVDNKYYFPDEKLAFSDMTNKLRAHEEHHEVVNALVDIAKARGWDKLTVRGSEEFRKQVWHRASVLGIEVSGYKPTDIEKARLAAELEKMGKGKPEQAATVNEIEKGIVQEKVADKPVSNVVPLRNFEGSLVEHGAAPYQFDKKEKQNYYVKLKTDQGEVKTVWGVDLERAITESGAQAGERIALQFLGKQKVEVMVNVKDVAGNVVGQEKALKDRNTWNVDKAEAFLTKDPKELVKAHPEPEPVNGTVVGPVKLTEAPRVEKEKPIADGKVEAENKHSKKGAISIAKIVEQNVERAEAFLTKDPKEVVKAHPELAPAYGTMALAVKYAETNFQQPADREKFVAGVKKVLGVKIEYGQPIPAPKIKSAEQEKQAINNQPGRRAPEHDAVEMER